MLFCINCGKELDEACVFCPECGTRTNDKPLNSETLNQKLCPKCKLNMPSNMLYCLECGYRFQAEQIQFATGIKSNTIVKHKHEKWVNKRVAFFLCLFLGMLGVHKFYEGKVIMGVTYLFTLGLFGLGWFIDLIILITKRNPYRVK